MRQKGSKMTSSGFMTHKLGIGPWCKHSLKGLLLKRLRMKRFLITEFLISGKKVFVQQR